jgi:hypothetical protein
MGLHLSFRNAFLPIAWVSVLLVGCASVPKPAQPFTSAGEALTLHALMRSQLHAIRAEARVDQRGDQGRIKGTVLMYVLRPGLVRFDAMTQFGPAAILTSDGQRFAYADLRNHRFLEGATCPYNIARLLNVPLSVEQTTELLLGGTPVLPGSMAAIGWHPDGYYHVRLRAPDGKRQEVDLGIGEGDSDKPPSRQRLRLLRSEVYDAKGNTIWRLTYDDYRPIARGTYRVTMPFLVRVEQPTAGRDTLIRFKEVALDPDVPASAFSQQPRPGMDVEEATCE